jgi:hypothetical protein
LWGALELLPAPKGIYPGTREPDRDPWRSDDSADPYPHPCVNFDPYRVEDWALGLNASAEARLQAALDAASEKHRRLYAWHCSLDQSQRDRMLVIAGVGQKTLFRRAYEPRFFGLWERAVKRTNRLPGDRHRDGDGRVPVASAALEWVTVRYQRGVHGGFTNIPAVYREVFRWLRRQPLQLPDTPHGALSAHLASGDDTSEAPYLDGSARIVAQDDPGLWDMAPVAPVRLVELEAELDQGRLPAFTRVRLL